MLDLSPFSGSSAGLSLNHSPNFLPDFSLIATTQLSTQTGLIAQSGLFTPTGLIAQGSNWWPAFLTPIWILAIGISIGAIVAAMLLGGLALLSWIPPLGRLADNRRAAVACSVVIGGLIAAGLCYLYLPRVDDQEYGNSVILPLIVLGQIGGFAIVYGMWHRTRAEIPQILTDGVVPYLLGTAATLTAVGLLSTPLVVDRMEILESIPKVNLLQDGTVVAERTYPGLGDSNPDEAPFVAADVSYGLRNLAELKITSDRNIALGDSADPLTLSGSPTRVFAGEPLEYRYADREKPPVPGDSSTLFVQNLETDPANVRYEFTSRPDVPQANSVVVIAILFFTLFISIVAFRQAAPRVWALALSTAKNEMAQPLFLLLMGMGIFAVMFFGFFPFRTLGADTTVLKDSGITLIMVLGMLQAVWSAGTSVSDEIEGRTALTVLSKPVSRRSFILGKYAGIMLAVLVMFAIIAAVFLVVLAYKPIYESRETTRAATVWQTGHDEIMSTLPVFGLYFMETAALGAVAVALATRLPLLANFITCFAVYVIGNLTSILVAASGGKFELVNFAGKLIAVVIPNLNAFNVQTAIDAGNSIPIPYLAAAFNYLVCFAIAVWMVAMLLFEDRDLA